jgi:hypothetical protein
MRMTASWSGSNDPTAYKSVTRRSVPNGEPPSDPQQTDRWPPDQTRSLQKARLAVHRRSACSGVKALRNTSAARRHAAKALLAFRSLAPFRALREPNRRRRGEERLSRSEQRTDYKPKTPLDRKSPIQVRIHSAPVASPRTISSLNGGLPSRGRQFAATHAECVFVNGAFEAGHRADCRRYPRASCGGGPQSGQNLIFTMMTEITAATSEAARAKPGELPVPSTP